MNYVNATQLAKELNLSKGRISQYVGEGKLDGCFEGEGRNRRFDLGKVAKALAVKLDSGQMMGNGADTRRAIQELPEARQAAARSSPAGATALPPGDNDRYTMARTLKAEEEARRLRKQNAVEEKQFVLRAEATLQAKRLVSKEIAGFESVLRDGARRIADDLGVDFKTARTILVQEFRAHRARRTEALADDAAAAKMTDSEKDADF